jgi:hypothetical protein
MSEMLGTLQIADVVCESAGTPVATGNRLTARPDHLMTL